MMLILSRMFLIMVQSPGMDDPGMPGGDPDLPETPLDSGVFLLIAVVFLYGVWRTRRASAAS